MKEELNHMKYLKINENKGYYLKANEAETDDWIEIDKINKDDLMDLLNKAVESDFEMDEYKEENLDNKAHQIIYKIFMKNLWTLLPIKLGSKMRA